MNGDDLSSEWTMPNAGEIGYTLVDDTGLYTNFAMHQVRVNLLFPEYPRVASPRPPHESKAERHVDVAGYAVALLLGCLLGFLVHMFLERIRRKT